MTVVPPSTAASSAAASTTRVADGHTAARPMYTPEERRRRDASAWTIVQAILAPFQFLVMALSLVLVLRYLQTGDGLAVANASVIVKTLTLYTIMVTGAIWEKEVFGQYLFAPSFFWEDVVSFGVIALHTAYLYGLWAGWAPRSLMLLALVAYAAYTVNAVQFILKLRAARLAEQAARAAQAAAASAPAEGRA